MHSTLKPKQTDDPHDLLVVAPDDALVAPAEEELSNLLRAAARHHSGPQTQAGSDFPAGPPVPPVDTTFRPAAVNDVYVPAHRRSIGWRSVRAFTALLLAACIGVAAIAGDAAKQMIAKWVPQFVVLSSSLPPDKPALPTQPTPAAVQEAVANAAPPQPAPVAQTAAEGVAPTAAALPPESPQLLQSMARDLATVGQEVEQLKASIEQLKASQQQMSRDVAKASEQKSSPEQNLRPRISAPPPRSAAAPARKPMPPIPPRQAAAAPTLPQAAAPSVPRQPEPEPQATAQPQPDPELSSVPRPPMPLR